jgi:hypothetical protein
MIYLNSENSETVGSVGVELAVWERAVGSPCQVQFEELEDNQVLREVNAKIRHYPHQRTDP